MIGYARCSTDAQDLTAQRDALGALGIEPDRIYVDHGLTGTNRARPGLREALAACCAGDTLVVTKLDRLARSVGRPLFNALAMIAEFEADLVALHRAGEHTISELEEKFTVTRDSLTGSRRCSRTERQVKDSPQEETCGSVGPAPSSTPTPPRCVRSAPTSASGYPPGVSSGPRWTSWPQPGT
ncbi:MAG: recombinase family protein [Pseudonocardia sp.]|nr:recombinase family protein [Pseudonocardia sp.]